MKVTILGCGHAAGTPIAGDGWGKCDPDEPKNRRLRPSILLEDGGTTLLVDTSPDLRQQLLAADVRRLDAVIYTHAHADHLHGIDDLRAMNRSMKAWIDVFADTGTWEVIEARFAYVLRPLPEDRKEFFSKPCLIRHDVTPGRPFSAGGIDITPFEQDHGSKSTLGFRIGKFAYSTDLVDLPEASIAALAGIDTWIIGALVDQPHPTHLHVDKALALIERVGPGLAVITHMSNQLDFQTLAERLPDGVEPAFDGMIIEI